MTDTALNVPGRTSRKWADIIAIVAGLCALANALWGPIIFATMYRQLSQGDRGVSYNWAAFGLGGLLALCAVALAQSRPRAGRRLIIIAGLLLLVVPFFYDSKPALPIATSVVLGLAMLVSAPFLGPMPAPARASRT
jgi:peptidoglycan/LPS O-acetylase OafA/YrhL